MSNTINESDNLLNNEPPTQGLWKYKGIRVNTWELYEPDPSELISADVIKQWTGGDKVFLGVDKVFLRDLCEPDRNPSELISVDVIKQWTGGDIFL